MDGKALVRAARTLEALEAAIVELRERGVAANAHFVAELERQRDWLLAELQRLAPSLEH
jgi:hypothetical protein